MRNWALRLEYDGSGFVGWQRQSNGLSVQAVLEAAASRITGAPVASFVAGRTDAGVHAEGQVVQLDLPAAMAPAAVRDSLNFHLKPHRVVVLQAAPAPMQWNPRFSAVGRTYRYVVLNRRPRPALLAGRVWHVHQPLDEKIMQEAARILLGRHDFTSFRAAACQAKSPIRTLDRLEVSREGERIEILAGARSFLHHQVRNMVGTLKLVGEGRWQPADVSRALAARDRRAGGPTAPPDGLFLAAIAYDVDPFAPA
jgi:tRNA pseudouridine38-40 synthase